MFKIFNIIYFFILLSFFQKGKYEVFGFLMFIYFFLILPIFFVFKMINMGTKAIGKFKYDPKKLEWAELYKKYDKSASNGYYSRFPKMKTLKSKYSSAKKKRENYNKIQISQKGNKYNYVDNGIVYSSNLSKKRCPRCGSHMEKKEGFKDKYYSCSNTSKCSYLERIPILIKK